MAAEEDKKIQNNQEDNQLKKDPLKDSQQDNQPDKDPFKALQDGIKDTKNRIGELNKAEERHEVEMRRDLNGGIPGNEFEGLANQAEKDRRDLLELLSKFRAKESEQKNDQINSLTQQLEKLITGESNSPTPNESPTPDKTLKDTPPGPSDTLSPSPSPTNETKNEEKELLNLDQKTLSMGEDNNLEGLLDQNTLSSVQDNMEKPLEQNILNPVQDNVEKPLEQNILNPVQDNVEKPLEQNILNPVQDNVEKPLEQNILNPVQDNVEKPLEQNILNPVQDNVEKPLEQNTLSPVMQNHADIINESAKKVKDDLAPAPAWTQERLVENMLLEQPDFANAVLSFANGGEQPNFNQMTPAEIKPVQQIGTTLTRSISKAITNSEQGSYLDIINPSNLKNILNAQKQGTVDNLNNQASNEKTTEDNTNANTSVGNEENIENIIGANTLVGSEENIENVMGANTTDNEIFNEGNEDAIKNITSPTPQPNGASSEDDPMKLMEKVTKIGVEKDATQILKQGLGNDPNMGEAGDSVKKEIKNEVKEEVKNQAMDAAAASVGMPPPSLLRR